MTWESNAPQSNSGSPPPAEILCQGVDADGDADRPTKVRFVVVVWLCSMAGLLYLDRICWGQATPAIQAEFQLSNTHMSCLMIAFQIAYALFEIPSGHWGDRLGARRVITRITIWWSLFTALTGAGVGFASLLVVRFLFGAGEAGAFPNAARVLTRWFPAHERGRVQGCMFTCSLVGGALAPYFASQLIEAVGWRWAFVAFGSIGILWAGAFWSWFRDTPDQHAKVNAAELAYIRKGGGGQAAITHEAVPWRAVLTNRAVLLLSSLHALAGFNTYFYFSWFPSYLQKAHGLDNLASGRLATLPLAGAALGTLIGGVVADQILRVWGDAVNPRRLFGSTAMAMAAIALYFAVHSASVPALTLLAAVSCFCLHITLPTWWSAAIEQSGRHVGPIVGFMNMMGVAGGLASQLFVGLFVDWQLRRGLTGRAQWDPMFALYVCLLFVAAGCWLLYRKEMWHDEPC